MPSTFGSKDKCIWCKSKEMSNYKEVPFVEKVGGEPEILFACSDACVERLEETQTLVQEGRKPFFVSLAAMFGSIAVATGLLFVHYYFIALMGLGMVPFGLVLMKYPMVTPQTILLFGFDKGLKMGRVGGAVLVIMGIVTAALAFVAPPPA